MGGDTDTVAACAGGPAGAYLGLKAIEASRPDAPAALGILHDATQPGLLDVGGMKKLAGELYVSVAEPALAEAARL